MPEIKTREIAKGTVKAIDKSAVAAERMKSAYIRTKEKADHSLYSAEGSPDEYAADRISGGTETVARETVHQLDKFGRKGVKDTKENISKAKDHFQQKKADLPKKQAQKSMQRVRRSAEPAKQSIKTVEHSGKTIKQTAKSTGKATVKTAKGTVKTTRKTVKTAERTSKAAIKTTQQAAKTAQKTAQATVKAAKAAAQAARATAKAVATGVKAAVKATIAAVKAIIAATKALIAAIAAGGWVAVVVIIVICLIGLIVGSCFGIFFSNEDTGSEYSMQSVIAELDEEFHTQIENTISTHPHDVLERSGATAAWEEVLSVYSVKTTTDPDDAADVASIDDGKKAIIREVFWLMNTINARTESRTETVVTQSYDSRGNVVETTTNVTKVYLIITVTHKTATEMADHYGFNEDQREQLAELLSEENRGMWDAVLAGVR